MAWLPILRSAVRIGLGRRPHQRDLDRVVETLRDRLLRGGALRDPARWKIPQDFALRRLRGLQLRKLKRTVALMRRWVPHYERSLADAPPIRSLADLARLPLTHREDLEADPASFVSRAPGLTPAVAMGTSGTTGRPIPLWLSPQEFDYYSSVQALSGLFAGFLGPSRILQVSVPLENSITARLLIDAAQRAGTLVLTPGLRGTLDDHLDSLLVERAVPGKSRSVTNLLCAPAYLSALTARAVEQGRDLSGSSLDTIFCFGAKTTPRLRERVAQAWGVKMREGYSLTETFGTGAIECEQGRLHFLDASGVLEVVDPDTLVPLPPGETGVGLISTLMPDRELQPLLRYWTNDLMRLSPETHCDCGRPSTIIEEIEGRADQVLIVGALNVHPQSIGDELVAFPELVQPPRFKVEVETRDAGDCCILQVEASSPLDEAARSALSARLSSSLSFLKIQHAGIGAVVADVRLLEPGAIAEPFPFKLVGPTPR